MSRYAKRQGKSHNKGWQVSALDNMCWRKKKPPQALAWGGFLMFMIRLLMLDSAGPYGVHIICTLSAIAQAWSDVNLATVATVARTDAFCFIVVTLGADAGDATADGDSAALS